MREEKATNELSDLLEIYLSGKLTHEQWSRMILLLGDEVEDDRLEPVLRRYWELQSPEEDNAVNDNAGEEIPAPPVRRIHFLKTAWFRYAAAIILITGGAAVYSLIVGRRSMTERSTAIADIAPGREGAILTLADGSQVVLDSLGNGAIAMQNGSRAVLNNGQLAYDLTGKAAGEILYNTMTTPKGRQFSVVLPDGTKVWLNAASSLRYPTQFSGRDRSVEITGEAYFEVTKDKAKPFHVKINDAAAIEVLGTSFNVNAYENEESVRTTLLEGSVRVLAGQQAKQGMVVLKPGQQAELTPHTSHLTTHPINTDQVLAWKNGAFNFNNASLQDVMKQLERWYDIEVVYEKEIPDIHFVGEMSRNVKLSGLLKVLEASKVRFRMEGGRRLVVLP